MIRLSESSLAKVPAGVAVPTYARDAMTHGIVHIGVGNFHRAHQALYLDELMHRGTANRWGICGVGLLAQDAALSAALQSQDYLYTLVERDGAGQAARVVGSIVDYLHAPSDPESVVAQLADPSTRIVSLTVTEAGYAVDGKSGLYGALMKALERRRDARLPPFTVQSCDNLRGNGDLVRRMLVEYAAAYDEALARWIEQRVAFPNSMVDRITPATSDALRDDVRALTGLDDAWPVMGERYRQWVIEDRFADGRPAYEDVGVQFTTDVKPYELAKIGLLNGGHQSLAHLGLALGYATSDEAMKDPRIVAEVTRYMDTVRPLLQQPAGMDLGAYQQTLLRRIANPAIKDPLSRIAADAVARIGEFVLPMARRARERGADLAPFANVVANWARHSRGDPRPWLGDLAGDLERLGLGSVLARVG